MINFDTLDKFLVDDFVKDLFLGFLQRIFGENPTEFSWDQDEEVSHIRICDQFSDNDLTPDFKPTIYIRRRPLGFMNTSIDQMIGQNMSGSTKLHTDLLTGTLELVSVSREGLEAARLAGIVFFAVQEFRGELRKLGMHDVSVKALGEEEPKDIRSTFRVVEVPVSVQYMFQYTWMKKTMGLLPLKEISIGRTTSALGEKIMGQSKGPCDGKYPIETCAACVESISHLCIPMTSDSPVPPSGGYDKHEECK